MYFSSPCRTALGCIYRQVETAADVFSGTGSDDRFPIISIRVRDRFRRDASHTTSFTHSWTVTGTRFNRYIYIKIVERHDGRWEGDMRRSGFRLQTDRPATTEVIARAYSCNTYFVWLVSFNRKETQLLRMARLSGREEYNSVSLRPWDYNIYRPTKNIPQTFRDLSIFKPEGH